MSQQAELLKKIDKLSPKYFGEVYDFVGYLQQKQQQETENAELEHETYEKNFSIPKNSYGKFILTKEKIDEMEKKSPTLNKIVGILHTDMTVEEIRMARLAKHL